MKKQCLVIATFLALGNVAVNGQETIATPPYTQDFYASADFNTMTIVDANEDGNTWTYASYDPVTYSPAARYTGSASTSANDWMISPALELKAGYVYNFSFNAIGVTGYTNNLDVMIGTAATASAMTTKVMDQIVLTERAKNKYATTISVATDGVYYIGFQVTAEANQGAIYIDDITVAEGIIANAPAAATALTATAAVQEAKAVMNISFTTPTTTNAGNALTAITGVKIYRGTTLIGELGAQTPGEIVNFTDKTPAIGNNAYKVVCVNEAGEGSSATLNATLSYSVAASPVNVVLTTTEAGQTITWDAVTTAASTNGVFIAENVTYTVTRSDKVEIAKGVKECTVTDTYAKDGEGQDLIYYNVVAVNEGGSSSASASPSKSKLN